MKAVSLFAGVGGFDLALSQLGVEVVASVEIDRRARSVLRKHFPKTQLLEDISDVTGKQLFKFGFEQSGIIVGGFPCQDLSRAGKRAGLAGARSGLFWEICRLLDETKAQYIILENVPGLLSSNDGEDMGTVVGALVERGYGIAYRVLDSQYFGVPQRRRRVFIVGSLGDSGESPAEILAIAEGSERYSGSRKQTREDLASAITTGAKEDYAGSFELWDFPTESISPCLSSKRAADTLTYSKARRAQNADDYETWEEGRVAPTLNVSENTNDTRATVIVFEDNRRDGIRVQKETTPTLQSFMGTGGNNTPMVSDEVTVRRITPIECERLQGFPDDWTKGQADSHRYKQMGNAITVPVASWIIRRLLDLNERSMSGQSDLVTRPE
jgi:DNA (cytosine-5)-methyltransferase 1